MKRQAGEKGACAREKENYRLNARRVGLPIMQLCSGAPCSVLLKRIDGNFYTRKNGFA